MRTRVVAIIAVICVFGVLDASAMASPALGSIAFMSCGQPPISDPELGISFPAEISYKRHPRHCVPIATMGQRLAWST